MAPPPLCLCCVSPPFIHTASNGCWAAGGASNSPSDPLVQLCLSRDGVMSEASLMQLNNPTTFTERKFFSVRHQEVMTDGSDFVAHVFFLFSISADQRQTALESLQCHFTWDLDCTRSVLLLLRDKLEDIGSEEGHRWLGHIYNLRGFIQHKLGLHDDAQRLFNQAAEAFHRMRHADQGPWLVVNYGNLAWLHHHLGDQEQSQAYLSQVDALKEEYPPPSQGELHAEVCAEKAWTLVLSGGDSKMAAGLFGRAAGMQPDMVEWATSHAIGLMKTQRFHLRKIRQAMDRDPENLYLAVLYLEKRAKTKDRVGYEAREFARNNLAPLSRSYPAFRVLLRVYKNHCSVDEAIKLAEEALRQHPDQRFLKKFAALCYKWKIIDQEIDCPSQETMNRAISLQKDVVSLYPHTALMKKIDLASLCAKSDLHQAEAEQIFEELLQTDLEPAEKQILYNAYAKYLYFEQDDSSGSIDYHMMAAEIPVKSYIRRGSIGVLSKIRDRGQDPRCQEIKEFLENLEEPV
ncbi:antiviral innate immune response effector IFIT1-like [Halichoeres trimaculatus]|uniref:antiviral innate immune response effector IFIT1-like n=1 Tax=Halichoeres trimaculatus TaxID=147232 RepID=UPI003D9DE9DD